MTLRAINQELGRPHNRRIVLEAIRQKGPITRTDIARRVGLTVQTVSTSTSELQELGFVSLFLGVPKGRGFPAPSLEVNPEGGYACGIYITPRGLEGGLINPANDILHESSRAGSNIVTPGAVSRVLSPLPTASEESVAGVDDPFTRFIHKESAA